jgi:hypothetical protein
MSASERRKGSRIEREIVDAHKRIGLKCERYPLSGATHFRGSGHDLDIYIHGPDAAPAVCEVKSRGNGKGFTMLERWLGSYDALFLRRDRQEPMVVLPWRVWSLLVGGGKCPRRTSENGREQHEQGTERSNRVQQDFSSLRTGSRNQNDRS